MENVFEIKYNTKLDRLEMPKSNLISRGFELIKRHKFITGIISISIILSCINFYLIYTFMNILQRV